MADLFRFPIPAQTADLVAELDQIITICSAVTGANAFPQGGQATYGDITPWHLAYYSSETPYCDVVLEFTADGLVTIGDGTAAQLLGLYGEILAGPGAGKYLLGALGITLAGAKPQIPIFSSTVGYAQIIQHVPCYDKLSVGGVSGAVPVDVARLVTVRARPIRHRSFAG
jgi:hypothetical protein